MFINIIEPNIDTNKIVRRLGGLPHIMPPTRGSKRSALSCEGRPSKFQANVPLSNSFQILNSVKPEKQVKPVKTDLNREFKSATITVTDKNIDISKLLGTSTLNYRLKILGIGTTIFGWSEKDREGIIDILKLNELEFFSHPYGDNKTFKGVPYPKSMWTWSKTAWRWGTILNNCGMFGHGASFCERNTSCLLCGEKHSTKTCPHAAEQGDNFQIIFKCINCKNLPSNHKATDNTWPERTGYAAIRGRNASRKSQTNSGTFARNTQLTNRNVNATRVPNVTFAEEIVAPTAAE